MQQSITDEKERIREIEIIVKSVWGNIHPITLHKATCKPHPCWDAHIKNQASPCLQGEVKLEGVKQKRQLE